MMPLQLCLRGKAKPRTQFQNFLIYTSRLGFGNSHRLRTVSQERKKKVPQEKGDTKRMRTKTIQDTIWSGHGHANFRQSMWLHKCYHEMVNVTHENVQLWGSYSSSSWCLPTQGASKSCLLDTHEPIHGLKALSSLSRRRHLAQSRGTPYTHV